jgi:hypothetical protein
MTILDDVKAQISELERLVPQPQEPLLFGRDLRCVTDLHEDMAETDPESPEGIGEAVLRRWTCPRGQNADDPNYGHDVRRLLNRATTRDELLAEAGLLRAEAEQEETVDTCLVALTADSLGREITITGQIFPKDPTIDPFKLVAVVTDGEAMLEIQRGF